MKLYITSILLLFGTINSFKFGLSNNKRLFVDRNKNVIKCNINPIDSSLEVTNNLQVDTSNFIGNIGKIIENNEKALGKNIVTQISTLLPKVDSVGHNILHANNEFITSILNNHMLSDDHQKFIILSSIKLAQYGDDMGSHLLQMYYNLVDKCL